MTLIPIPGIIPGMGLEKWVPADEAEKKLGVNRRAIEAAARSGNIPARKSSSGVIEVELLQTSEMLDTSIESLAEGDGDFADLETAKLNVLVETWRKLQLDNERKRLELAEKQGDVLERAEVEEMLAARARAARRAFDGLPARNAVQLSTMTNIQEIADLLRREIREALQEMLRGLD